MKRILQSLLFAIIVLEPLLAQENTPSPWTGIGVEQNIKWGSMLKHSEKFTGPVSNNVWGYELHLLQQTYGKSIWQQRRNFPLIGLAFNYMNYGYNDIYGSVLGLSPTITLNLLKYKNFSWTFRAGFGLGYVTKYYQRPPAPSQQNAAIGGHLNNVSPLSTDIRWTLNERIALHAGFFFTHVSNASIQIPNLGINTYGAQIGVRYFPLTAQPNRIIRDHVDTWRNQYGVQVRTSVGFKEVGSYGGPRYQSYLLGIQGYKLYQSKNRVYFGAEYQYHQQVYAFHKSNFESKAKARSEAGQLAIHLGHEFIIGRFGIIGQLGYYIKDVEERSIPLYQKIGTQFYIMQRDKGFIKHLYANILLKTHLANAEMAEIGIGMSF